MYPFPKAWGEETQRAEGRWGADVPLCPPALSLGGELPHSFVVGNVKTFLTLTVFLFQMLVTIPIMLFRRIHFQVWSTCNSSVAAELFCCLQDKLAGQQKLLCPPETINHIPSASVRAMGP